MKRRKFIQQSALATMALSQVGLLTHCQSNQSSTTTPDQSSKKIEPIRISLAQWSLNRAFRKGALDPNKFASIAKGTYQINAIEYVNQFYMDQGTQSSFWKALASQANSEGVKSLLIMVDDEGDLGNPNEKDRLVSVENHFKWVEAAQLLGCHSIRVNAFGTGESNKIKAALIDGMGRLSEFAADLNINVLIENHGLFSSDAPFIVDVIQQVNLPNFGTLPDFGNWCTSAQWGSIQKSCEQTFDLYEGVKQFLPYAKGVSAKSYEFDEAGNETRIDYQKMLKLVLDVGYDGYVGIEYEGEKLSEHDGILATKKLLENAWQTLHE